MGLSTCRIMLKDSVVVISAADMSHSPDVGDYIIAYALSKGVDKP